MGTARRRREPARLRTGTSALALCAALSATLVACGGQDTAGGPAADPSSTAGGAGTGSPTDQATAAPAKGARSRADRLIKAKVAPGQRITKIPQPSKRLLRKLAAAASNPLAGRPWGTYLGPTEMSSGPYAAASGETKRVLSWIAEAPKATWFGAWISDDKIEERTREYVAAAQGGDPETLVQLTDFRAVPWEHEACGRLPSAAEQESYRRWTDSFARGIGDAHAAVVLQPDGPFALCTPGGVGVQTELIKSAVERLSQQPNTSVYIEVGASDWPAPGQGGVAEVMRFLLPAGIEQARGIALNGTHYAATGDEIRHGAEVVRALADRGITDKHVVINTSSNGNPFTYGAYQGSGRWAHPDNARPCSGTGDGGTCVSLGIPPTADVTDPAWGLSSEETALAEQYVDGYLWFGRPWLHFQNSPFELDKALAIIRSSPYWPG